MEKVKLCLVLYGISRLKEYNCILIILEESFVESIERMVKLILTLLLILILINPTKKKENIKLHFQEEYQLYRYYLMKKRTIQLIPLKEKKIRRKNLSPSRV